MFYVLPDPSTMEWNEMASNEMRMRALIIYPAPDL